MNKRTFSGVLFAGALVLSLSACDDFLTVQNPTGV
jgi:hypothetical protein